MPDSKMCQARKHWMQEHCIRDFFAQLAGGCDAVTALENAIACQCPSEASKMGHSTMEQNFLYGEATDARYRSLYDQFESLRARGLKKLTPDQLITLKVTLDEMLEIIKKRQQELRRELE
jgi:hypothetical protein